MNKKYSTLALSSKGHYGIKKAVAKPSESHEEKSLDTIDESKKTASQSPCDRRSSKTKLTI